MSNIIDETLARIPGQRSTEIEPAVRGRWDSLTKPRGSLGLLEDEIVKLAIIQGDTLPRTNRRGMYVFCGDHGITEEGVSLYPSVVTREMAKNFVRGGAAINVLCRHLTMETCIVDAGIAGDKLAGVLDRRVAPGTANFLHAPAMTRQEAQTCLEGGIRLARDAAERFDIVGVGEMGIGNSTSASALLCAFTGASPSEAVGPGTGLAAAAVQHKRNVVAAALQARNYRPADTVSVIEAFGGFEIAMMAGFILGAASCKLAVVVDGFISGAAFLIANSFYPKLEDHVFFGHRSSEPGHAWLLGQTQAKPLLQLDMRLGEGTGAALAISMLTLGCDLYREMATFAEAAVSDIALNDSPKTSDEA